MHNLNVLIHKIAYLIKNWMQINFNLLFILAPDRVACSTKVHSASSFLPLPSPVCLKTSAVMTASHLWSYGLLLKPTYLLCFIFVDNNFNRLMQKPAHLTETQTSAAFCTLFYRLALFWHSTKLPQPLFVKITTCLSTIVSVNASKTKST